MCVQSEGNSAGIGAVVSMENGQEVDTQQKAPGRCHIMAFGLGPLEFHTKTSIVLFLDLRHIQDTRKPKWLHFHELSLREKGFENHLV